MKFINKFLLRFALLPASLYRKIGVNTDHLRAILTTKLIMDDRRPNTFHMSQQKKSKKQISAATFGTILLSAFLGFVFILSFKLSRDFTTQLTIYFSLYFVMLVSTLISDFTSVLIDVRDNNIILPKPVSDKTFVLSRLLHILIHVTKIVVPMSLPGVIYLAVFNGYRSALVLFIIILLASVFAIFLINVVYLVILKFVSPQKFQTIINYVQISMTIVVFVGYQIIVRMIDKIEVGNFDIKSGTWVWIAPSYWFALGTRFFINFSSQPSYLIGGLIVIVLPPLSLWIVIKYFAPAFNQKLALITNSSEEKSLPRSTIQKKKSNSLTTRLSQLMSKKGEERMGFLLTWKLTGRLKDFKLKVYPSVGSILVVFVFMIFRNGIDLHDLKAIQGSTRLLVMGLVYSSAFLLIVALTQMQFSEKYKAAWFYFTMPVQKPGLILSGALKAATVKFYVPIILILSVIIIALSGPGVFPNILLGVSNILLGAQLLSLLTLRNFPFSAMQETNQKAGSIFRSLISMASISTLALIHYLIFNFTLVVFISLGLSVLANWLLLDYIKNKSWTEILSSYDD